MDIFFKDKNHNELLLYKPELRNKPEDFNMFWSEEKAKIENLQYYADLARRDYPVSSVEVIDIKFESFDGTPLYGIFIKPKSQKKIPLLFSFHGYTGSRGLVADYLKWIALGVGVIAFDIRGQGDSPDFANYKKGSRIPGWMLRGIEDKESYYYTNVYRDILMQLKWILSDEFPFTVTKLGVMGGSQGGGLALVAAGLEDSVEFLIADCPFNTYFEKAIEQAESGPYIEITDYFKWNDPHYIKYSNYLNTLSYIDSLHFCQTIKCPTLMSVGLKDIVTPPLTIYAAFNHLESLNKKLEVYPQFGHEINSFHEEKKIEFVAKILAQ